MLSNNKKILVASVAALAMTSGAFAAKSGRAQIEKLPPAPMQSDRPGVSFEGGDPDPSMKTMAPVAQEKVNYDEVGYADIGSMDGGRVAIATPALPTGSYAEVTDLASGRTILTVVEAGPVARGRIASLSSAAAAQLGLSADGGVRVRRTNPPSFERNALAGGGQAAERLETPPTLLNALRKKLGPRPAGVAVAAAPRPKAPPARPAPPMRPVAPPPPAAEPTPPEFAAAEAEVAASAGDGRFIEEEARPHWRVGKMASAAPQPRPVPQPMARQEPSWNWYLQVAAFSSEPRARAAASRIGGSVIRAGSVYRVRSGPYASEAAARGAVGAMAAKGYPGARITR
jgi:rare lipoprotein A